MPWIWDITAGHFARTVPLFSRRHEQNVIVAGSWGSRELSITRGLSHVLYVLGAWLHQSFPGTPVLVECCGAVGQFDHAQGNRVKDVALSIANDQVDCPKYESLEMNDHLRYEELTALAAAGYLSDEECQDLLKHFASCEQCRNSGRAFRDIVRCLWPARDKLHELIDNWEDDEAVRARFIERVRQEGIKLSRDIPPRKRSRD